MITASNFGSIRTIWFRGRNYFVSFTGRFACGRPETCWYADPV